LIRTEIEYDVKEDMTNLLEDLYPLICSIMPTSSNPQSIYPVKADRVPIM